ncbi:hypothetical protein TanjilG_11512 [Lupinus angustifolius]|uniref:Uncharacterized protein n=1 Tax=Lupinus angustifolius TaxID=3871 RepID=A0A1J7I1T0_LUPAN|nr:hypothetical protein TanjilG_11512 [Lupinus angustifolius]
MFGRTSTQHRNQSSEDYDGCVDEVNDVGVHCPACSKPIAKESDSLFSYSNLSPKRARIKMKSCCMSKSLQCSQRMSVAVPNTYQCSNDIGEKLTEHNGIKVTKLNKKWTTSQPMKVVMNKERGTHAEEYENVGRCELSLSLPLPNPSPKGSNVSSASEISEAITSCPGFTNFKDCSSSSTVKDKINLDLSLALCAN